MNEYVFAVVLTLKTRQGGKISEVDHAQITSLSKK